MVALGAMLHKVKMGDAAAEVRGMATAAVQGITTKYRAVLASKEMAGKGHGRISLIVPVAVAVVPAQTGKPVPITLEQAHRMAGMAGTVPRRILRVRL